MKILGNRLISLKLKSLKYCEYICKVEINGEVVSKVYKLKDLRAFNVYSIHSREKNKMNYIAISFNSNRNKPIYKVLSNFNITPELFFVNYMREFEVYDAMLKLEMLHKSSTDRIIDIFRLLRSFNDCMIYELYRYYCTGVMPNNKVENKIASLLASRKIGTLYYDPIKKCYVGYSK